MRKPVHLALAGINAGLLLFCGLFFFLFTVNIIVRQAHDRGLSDAGQVYQDLQDQADQEGLVDFQETALTQAQLTGAHIIMVDQNSNLLADSRQGLNLTPGKYINAEMIEAKSAGTAVSTIRSRRTGTLSIAVALQKPWESGTIIIYLAYRIGEEQRLVSAFTVLAVILSLLVASLVYLILLYLLNRFKRPLKKLLKHTAAVSPGGYNKLTVETPDPELGQLVDNFNSLVDHYNHLIEQDNRKYSRFNTLLSNLSTGILMVDPDNKINLVNPEAEKLLRIDKISLFGVRNRQDSGNKILEEILDRTRQAMEPGGKNSRYTTNTPEGEILDITMEVTRSKYEPREISGVLVLLRDVTEMRRMEKLKDEFVSNVSHELRTPLTVISGFVETLKGWEMLTGNDRDTALNIIEVETERLKKLISEILLLSRIEGEMTHARKRLIPAAQAVNQSAAALQPLADKKNLRLYREISEPLEPLYGIAGWFRQIVYNLLDNAIKYTPPGGAVTVRLFTQGSRLCLEVEDTGPGIPPEEKDRIFERFYRGSAARNSGRHGTGLGLSIAQQIIRRHQGEITLSSPGPSGQGAAFTALLPAGVPAAETDAK